MRNMIKQARVGAAQIRRNDDLTLTEIAQFYEIAANAGDGATWEVMKTAYFAGYAAGIRTAEREKGNGNI